MHTYGVELLIGCILLLVGATGFGLVKVRDGFVIMAVLGTFFGITLLSFGFIDRIKFNKHIHIATDIANTYTGTNHFSHIDTVDHTIEFNIDNKHCLYSYTKSHGHYVLDKTKGYGCSPIEDPTLSPETLLEETGK